MARVREDGTVKTVPYRVRRRGLYKRKRAKEGKFTPSPMFSQKTHLIPKGEALAI